MPELVAILSSFNRKALLQSALRSLAAQLPGAPIAIFEAGSTDGSAEWIAQFHRETSPPIHVVTAGSAGNSFSAGVNRAAEFALSQFPDLRFLLLFETDNALENSTPITAARELLDANPSLAAAGFSVRKYSGAPAGFGCSFPTALQFLIGPQLSHWLRLDAPCPRWTGRDGAEWSYSDVVYTSPILIRREAWSQSGGFDAARFPFADCDLDWAWRLRKLGFRQAVVKTNAVIHDNRDQLSNWSATRALHFHRARLELLSRHHRIARALLCPLLGVRHLLELAVLALRAAPRPRYTASLRQRWLLLTRVFRGYRLK